MKKIVLLFLSACISLSAVAQSQKSSTTLTKLKQLAEMKKNSQHRQHKATEINGIFSTEAQVAPASSAKGETTTLWATEMPTDRWFPGEWEEVQAIVVTFPYQAYPAGHMNDDDYVAEPQLPGMGVLYKYNYSTNSWQYYNGGWGSIDGTPDVTDYQDAVDYYSGMGAQYQEHVEYYQNQLDHRNVFVNLIHGIQQQAQVWITVWHLSDSTLIKNFMASEGKPLTNYRFIECYANAFWYRDCGPICFYYGDNDDIAMLNFEYSGRACDDLLPDSIASQTGLPNYTTTIEWEGGNCLVDGTGKLFTSDAIYDENGDTYGQAYATGNSYDPIGYRNKPALSQAAVRDSMQRMFGSVYVLPRLQYDGGTGHVDLYADMWDENEFIFSQYPDYYSNWSDYTIANNNIETLTGYQSIFGINYKKSYIPFPSRDDGSYFTSQRTYDKNFTRSYSNHLFVNNMIIQPCFSKVVDGQPSAEWDRANIDTISRAYPGYTIFPIDIRSFDGSGGAIHCITKQIPADNPIRILHASTTRHFGLQRTANKMMEATITNRSGIASAQLVWRVNGGEWHTVALANGDQNRFSGTMNFAEAGLSSGTQAVVEYYISATSNNGKTITKPMTASQGGYYTFDLLYEANAGIADIAEQQIGQFYPNPSNGQAIIEMNGIVDCRIRVADALGRVVFADQIAGDSYRLDCHGWAKGVYSVCFTSANGNNVVRRLVIQ